MGYGGALNPEELAEQQRDASRSFAQFLAAKEVMEATSDLKAVAPLLVGLGHDYTERILCMLRRDTSEAKS